MRSASLMLLLLALVLPAVAQAPPATPDEWKPVEAALHRSGAMQPGDVFKFGLPRSDLKLDIGGVPVATGVALGGWAAFKKMGSHAVVMGDLVLTESEVAPVMKRLQGGASRSPRCTTTCWARARMCSTCTTWARATPPSWPRPWPPP